MIVTIKVLRVAGGGSDRERCVARGYLPSGQEVITSPIHFGGCKYTHRAAIRSVVEWIFGNRPTWAFEIDDERLGYTEVVP